MIHPITPTTVQPNYFNINPNNNNCNASIANNSIRLELNENKTQKQPLNPSSLIDLSDFRN